MSEGCREILRVLASTTTIGERSRGRTIKPAYIIYVASVALENALVPRAIMRALTTLSRYSRPLASSQAPRAGKRGRNYRSERARAQPRRGAPMAHAINLHSSFWHVSRGGRKRYLRRMKYVGNAFLSPREYCKLTLARARFGTAYSRNDAGVEGRDTRRRGRPTGKGKKKEWTRDYAARLSSDDWSIAH